MTHPDIHWPLMQNRIRKGMMHHTFGSFPQRVRAGNPNGNHGGWDLFSLPSTPCFAIANGEIKDLRGNAKDKDGFGLVIILKFALANKIYYAAYCHLASSLVATGSEVVAGRVIGYTGNSGNAYNMKGEDQHLHFEIRERPVPNPGQKYRLSPLFIYGPPPLVKPKVDVRNYVGLIRHALGI